MKDSFYRVFRRLYFGSHFGFFGLLLKVFLIPFVPMYVVGRRINQYMRNKRGRQLPCPVLSVGNISVGGAGKTAVVAFVVEKLRNSGFQPAILKRGEGTKTGIIDENFHGNSVEMGDEVALLHDRFPEVPIGVGPNRFSRAVELLDENDLDCFLLDDGFQRRQLHRDLDIVLLGSLKEFDGWQLPAGPLRESIHALERADYVSLKTESTSKEGDYNKFVKRLETTVPELSERAYVHYYEFDSIQSFDGREWDSGSELHLLSTLARPDRLEQFLENQGYKVTVHKKLPDHASLESGDLGDEIEPEQLVVTKKEWGKLPDEYQETAGIIKSYLRWYPEVPPVVEWMENAVRKKENSSS
ncbi:MAG: tetraacyldisaccharide 4'-kinase [bacterium]